MKKMICVWLSVLLLTTMISCNNTTTPNNGDVYKEPAKTPVQEVEEKIQNLGTINDAEYETQQALEEAEDAYEKLNDAEKEQIGTYAYKKLKRARRYFDFYNLKEQAIGQATLELKSRLKNPASLQVHSVEVEMVYDSNKEIPLAVHVSIDYSAQNGFGGYNRDTELWGRDIKNNRIGKESIPGVNFRIVQQKCNGVYVDSAHDLF